MTHFPFKIRGGIVTLSNMRCLKYQAWSQSTAQPLVGRGQLRLHNLFRVCIITLCVNNKGAGQNDGLKCKKKRERDGRKEEKERIWSCSLTVCWDNNIPGPSCCRKLNSSRWSMLVECVCLMACLSVLRLHEALTALSAKTHFLSLHSRLPPPPLQLTHSFERKAEWKRGEQ